MALPSALQKKIKEINDSYANPSQEAPKAIEAAEAETPEVLEPTSSPEPTTEPSSSQLDDIQHKLSVLQGKYNAEIPRYANQVRDLEARLSAKDMELSQIKQAPVQSIPEVRVNRDSLEELGGTEFADQMELIQKTNQMLIEQNKTLTETVKTFESRLDQTGETVQKTVSQSNAQILAAILKEKGINSQEMNNDAGFIAWLDEEDVYSGDTKYNLMNSAYKNGQIERAAKFFIDYAQSQKTPVEAPVKPQTKKQFNPTVSVTPSAVPSSTAPINDVMSAEEINEFYAKHRKGLLTKEEYDTGQKRIFHAK